jgi:2-hydroxychromene-2-carboxylate isomerase
MKKTVFHFHSLCSPWASLGGTLFRGQDRIDFLDEPLSS